MVHTSQNTPHIQQCTIYFLAFHRSLLPTPLLYSTLGRAKQYCPQIFSAKSRFNPSATGVCFSFLSELLLKSHPVTNANNKIQNNNMHFGNEHLKITYTYIVLSRRTIWFLEQFTRPANSFVHLLWPIPRHQEVTSMGVCQTEQFSSYRGFTGLVNSFYCYQVPSRVPHNVLHKVSGCEKGRR